MNAKNKLSLMDAAKAAENQAMMDAVSGEREVAEEHKVDSGALAEVAAEKIEADASVDSQDSLEKPDPTTTEVPVWLYPAVAVGCAVLVMVLYGPLGLSVAVPVLIYVGALSTITLSVKFVLSLNHFPYPKLLTSLHFITGALATGGILLYRKVADGKEIPMPTVHELSMMIVPIALALELSVVANNMALVHSSASFTEILGSANCVVTMGVVAAMGMPLDPALIAPALLVAFGCGVASYGDVDFSLLGCILCLTACFLRSIKVALQQKLLTGKAREKFDPVALLFWIAVPSFVLMMGLSFATEGLAPYRKLAGLDSVAFAHLQTAMILSCFNALILNLAQLYVTKHLGAVGSQLAAQMKMTLVVLGGVALFGEKITTTEIVGFAMSITGVYWFSRTDASVKEKQAKEAAMAGTANGAIKAGK